MRRILVENARYKMRDKHGAGRRRCDMLLAEPPVFESETDIVAIDEALSKLAEKHPEKAELVKLRFFAGMTLAEAAATLGLPRTSANRHWKYARAWLGRELRKGS